MEHEIPPPPAEEIEVVAAQEQKKISSSYENVYTGVPLEPETNRMSMEVTEMDIGDRFDTKQQDTKLDAAGLSSSYERLYEKEKLSEASDDEGECKSEATTVSSASAVADIQSSSTPLIVRSTHAASSHVCPVYITVESGLDKLACDAQGDAKSFSAYDGHGIRVRSELAERSVSCDTETMDDPGGDVFRPCSSPDVYSPAQEATPSLVSSNLGTFSTPSSGVVCELFQHSVL